MEYSLTLAVFSKNEDATVALVVDGILAHYNPCEVLLVVSNVSEYVQNLAQAKSIGLLKDSGKGKGNAIQEVISVSTSDIFVFIDADGSHNTNDIPLIVQPIIENRADMVIASRFKGGSEEFSGNLDNYLHLLGNYLSSIIIQLFWGDFKNGLMDCQNGFRAIRAGEAKKLCLQENGFAIEQEMVIQGLKKGLRIIDIPSLEIKRKHGKSHINYTSSLAEYIWSIIRNIIHK